MAEHWEEYHQNNQIFRKTRESWNETMERCSHWYLDMKDVWAERKPGWKKYWTEGPPPGSTEFPENLKFLKFWDRKKD